MSELVCTLEEIHAGPDGVEGILRCPPTLRPDAGQYLLAHIAGGEDVLSTPVFVSGIREHGLQLAGPLPAAWTVGTRLAVRGPLGHGFKLPASAHHIVLASLTNHGSRLGLLVETALSQEAFAQEISIVFCGDSPASGFPSAVEVLPLESLPDLLAWTDYFALDAAGDQASAIRKLLHLLPGQRCPALAQVLVETPLACGGLAECGLCAVETRRGWKLACEDGPVFDLDELEE
jgi:dihydroorotate dehydrogenase electron transfer subunit